MGEMPPWLPTDDDGRGIRRLGRLDDLRSQVADGPDDLCLHPSTFEAGPRLAEHPALLAPLLVHDPLESRAYGLRERDHVHDRQLAAPADEPGGMVQRALRGGWTVVGERHHAV